MLRFLVIGALTLTILASLVPGGVRAGGPASAPVAVRGSAVVPPHSWPASHFSPGNNAYNFYENILTATNVSQLQAHTIFSTHSPYILSNGVIFQGGTTLMAIVAATGQVSWTQSTQVDGIVTDGQAIYGMTVLCHGQGSGSTCFPTLIVFAAGTGGELWQHGFASSLSSCCNQDLTLANGIVYAGFSTPHGAGWLYALSAATGKVLWWRSLAGGPILAYGDGTPKPTLYLFAAGTLEALNAATGAVLWRRKPALHQSSMLQGLMYGEGRLYLSTAYYQEAGAVIGQVQAFDIHGTVLWTVGGTGHNTFGAAAGGAVYLLRGCPECFRLDMPDVVVALNAATGAQLWEQTAIICTSACSTPILANGLLYVGGGSATDSGGTVQILNAATGDIVTTLGPSTDLDSGAPPIVVDGVVHAEGVQFSLS